MTAAFATITLALGLGAAASPLDPAAPIEERCDLDLARRDPQPLLSSDPSFAFSTFLGGSGGNEEGMRGVAADPQGNVVVTGYTVTTDFPVLAAVQPATGGWIDAVVVKLAPDGRMLFSTYLGGSSGDDASDVAVDANGDIYVVGSAESTNFPVTPGAFQVSNAGFGEDVFVTKLSADGSQLLYSTYLGGRTNDVGNAIAVDPTGAAYVAGFTKSDDFPVLNAVQATKKSGDEAIVAKLSPDGSQLLWSTYLGSVQDDYAEGIAVDASGSAAVTGRTYASGFPTRNAIQPDIAPFGSTVKPDAFLTRFTAAGNDLVFSTYLGGREADQGLGVAIDGAGNVWMTGITSSSNFPVAQPLKSFLAGTADAFVVRVPPDGSLLSYSTYLGGNSVEGGYAIAIEPGGDVLVGGYTGSTDFPLRYPAQGAIGGASDGFIARLSQDGSAVLYATFVGGSNGEILYGVAASPDGAAVATGTTFSTDYPVVAATQPTYGGGLVDGFAVRVCPFPAIEQLLAVRTPPSDLTLSWAERSEFGEYHVYSGLAKSPAPALAVGTTPFGSPRLQLPEPPESLVFYQVVGANACGEGPM